jgi:cellulose synthase/poly-beta-1,6-N-acetylglucosamine synthase-like glycosyltransferase
MHGERSLARERLGLSCGLRGNGMAFATRLLREVPHQAWSVVEDLEYGIALGLAGHRVAYVAEAEVCGEMAADEKASRTQRRRWEEGRRALADQHGWALLRRGIVERDALLADLGLDLLVPPLATLAVWAGALSLAVLVGRTLGWPLPLASWLLGTALVLLAAHVLRGWWLSGTGLLGLRDLLLVPSYVAWKLALRLAPRRPAAEWVRTPRAGED